MNVKSRTIFTGDNLHILRGMENETVDLIYLDPPFNKKKTFSAPIGSKAAGAAFKDTWTLDDVDIAWHDEIGAKSPPLYMAIEAAGRAYDKGMKSYLIMMAVRLLEMRRILKDSGSVYLHCDPTASHYLKILMDCVFGKENFRNEIIWCYSTSGRPKNRFAPKHDTIFYYSKSREYYWSDYRIPVGEKYLKSHYRQRDDKGRRCRVRTDHGKTRVYYPEQGMTCNDWWEIPYLNSQSPERLGYPTQKPLALLKRIIEASSREDDIVLDPFCGCATALVASENLRRKWIGIDISETASRLVRSRMRDELGLFSLTIFHRTDVPKRKGKRSKNIKTILYGKQGGDCNLCGVHFLKVNLTVDHIVPQAHGGLNDDDNLQLLCQRCNSIKGTGTMQEAKARMKKDREI